MNNMQNPCPMPVMIPVPIYCMSPYQYGGTPQMYNMPYPYGNMAQMNNMNLNPYGNMGQMNNMFPFPFGFPKPPQKREPIRLTDYGPQPTVVDINDATEQNNNFRIALWTGEHLQVTLMSINVGDDIGLEVHPDGDQFIRIEEGDAIVRMGDSKDNLDYERRASDDSAIMIPAGKWHNIINAGNSPLKLYAIYAPPEHPKGTVHPTKADVEGMNSRLRYRY